MIASFGPPAEMVATVLAAGPMLGWSLCEPQAVTVETETVTTEAAISVLRTEESIEWMK
jgi:hypothetical protein